MRFKCKSCDRMNQLRPNSYCCRNCEFSNGEMHYQSCDHNWRLRLESLAQLELERNQLQTIAVRKKIGPLTHRLAEEFIGLDGSDSQRKKNANRVTARRFELDMNLPEGSVLRYLQQSRSKRPRRSRTRPRKSVSRRSKRER